MWEDSHEKITFIFLFKNIMRVEVEREWNSSLCTLTAYCYVTQAFSLTVSTKHKNTTPTIKTVHCS